MAREPGEFRRPRAATTLEHEDPMDAQRLMVSEQSTETQVEMLREEIVKKHVGLVHQTVSRVCGSLAHSNGTYDDLVSAGLVGLLEAYEVFDASRGVAFSTYAAPRVRGAILDELRKQDFVPRSVRRKARVVGKARVRANSRVEGAAAASVVAEELGVSLPTLFQWELDAELGSRESLDAMPMDLSAASEDAIESAQGHYAPPDSNLLREEEVESVREAIARLPEQERLVLILSFYEDMKLKQIGELMGVSESRVSQIRTRALTRLREEMARAAA